MHTKYKRIFEVAIITTATILGYCLCTGCSGGDAFSAAAPTTPAGTDAAVVATTGGSNQLGLVSTGGAAGETAMTGGTAATTSPTGGQAGTDPATGGQPPVTTATGGTAATGGATSTTPPATGGGPAGYGTASGCYRGASCTGPVGCDTLISNVTQTLVCCNGRMALPTDDQCTQCVPIKNGTAGSQPSFDACAKLTKRPWVTCTTAPSIDCYMLGDGLACCNS